jgi:hypothetical protein
MNPLEGRLIMISRLAAKCDELFSARAHVPLVIERDPARKVAFFGGPGRCTATESHEPAWSSAQSSLRRGLLSYRATMQLLGRLHGSCQCYARS